MNFKQLILKLGKRNFTLYKTLLVDKRVFNLSIIYSNYLRYSSHFNHSNQSIHKYQLIQPIKTNFLYLQNSNQYFLYLIISFMILCQIYRFLKLRSYHYPIQYIFSEWQFMDLKLKIKPPVLIPRFQTEQMLRILFEDQRFIKNVQNVKKNDKIFKVLQLGCGSGAIGLAISKYLQCNNIKYHIQMIDIQPLCIKLSIANLKHNNLSSQNFSISQSNMLQLLQLNPPQYFHINFNLIISNPPYISVSQYNNNKFQKQVKKYQSKQALVGNQKLNQNGLYYVENILRKICINQFNQENYKKNSQNCLNQSQNNIINQPIVVLQYGGQDLSHLGKYIQSSVVNDYYDKRRFIMIFPSKKQIY